MDEVFAKAMRLFQYGLLDGQNAMNYGVSTLRHEAPRRLRVRGDDIVTGAKLLLSVPWPVLPYSGLPPSDPAARATFPTLTLELPIYPTDDVVGGQSVWETAVELDPLWAYALMLGCHHHQRLLRDPRSLKRTRAAYQTLLAAAR